MLIDSHCHLEYKGLVEDRQGVLDRARAAGVKGFLSISTRQSEWDQVIGTAEAEDDVWASVGIHPHEADQHADLGEAALLASVRPGWTTTTTIPTARRNRPCFGATSQSHAKPACR